MIQVFFSCFGQVVFVLFIFTRSLGGGFGRYSKDKNQGSNEWCFAYGRGSAKWELESLSPDSTPVPFSLSPRPERHQSHMLLQKTEFLSLFNNDPHISGLWVGLSLRWLISGTTAWPRAGIRNPLLNNVYHWVPGFWVHCGHWLQEVLIGYGDLLVHWGSMEGLYAILPRCSSLFHHQKFPNTSVLPHHKGFCE